MGACRFAAFFPGKFIRVRAVGQTSEEHSVNCGAGTRFTAVRRCEGGVVLNAWEAWVCLRLTSSRAMAYREPNSFLDKRFRRELSRIP